MIKIKIIDVRNLTFPQEEIKINEEIQQLEEMGCNVFNVSFRQNSVIIQYIEFNYELRNEDYRCHNCKCSCQEDNVSSSS